MNHACDKQGSSNHKSWNLLKNLEATIKPEKCDILQESDDLRAGLRDTVKHIAEELDIKPTVLNKAIKIAYKNSLSEERDAFDDIEMILDTIKRGGAQKEE